MKKYFIMGVAFVCMLAFAMPAMAALKITGATNLDLYWFDKDKEVNAGGVAVGATTLVNDRTEFHMNTRRPNNYIQFAYTNDAGTLGSIMRLRHGGADESSFAAEQTHFSKMYIWWKPSPSMQIQIGTINQIVGGLTPDTSNLGHQFGGTGGPVGINFGNLHSSERNGIAIFQKINKNIGLEFGIYDPDDDNGPAPGGAALPTLSGLSAAASEEIDLPRVDLGIPIKVGKFQTKPKFSIVNREFDQVVAGSEDSYTIWAASIDMRYTFGPLRLTGEYSFGENLADANHTGAGGPITLRAQNYVVPGTASTNFEDTEQDLWFLSARYNFSKSLAFLATYGESEAENDASPGTTGDDWKLEASYWSFVIEYKLFPNFRIYPTYSHFDRGDNNLRAGTIVNNGEEEYYGLKFQLVW
jgi:hypothetical protein